MDGYEAATRIRAQEKSTGQAGQIPIIALTAHASAQDRSNCLDYGMNGFVTKPMTIEDLETALDEVF